MPLYIYWSNGYLSAQGYIHVSMDNIQGSGCLLGNKIFNVMSSPDMLH